MPVTVDSDALIIGKPNLYYRDVDVLTAWTFAGPIIGDMSFTVDQTWADQPDLGQRGPIIGTHYMANRVARASFSLAEVGGGALAIAIPGSTTTTRVTTATAGGFSTTMAAASVVGATNVKATAVTNMDVGEYVKIGTGSTAEYRQLTTVGTLGSGGTGISFVEPLRFAHANLETLVQTDGDGAIVVSASDVRRLPTTAYKDWLVLQQAPAGYVKMYLENAIAVVASAAMTFGSNTWAGLPVTLEATFPESDQVTEPWHFETLPA